VAAKRVNSKLKRRGFEGSHIFHLTYIILETLTTFENTPKLVSGIWLVDVSEAVTSIVYLG
jgi:hypothetical protein